MRRASNPDIEDAGLIAKQQPCALSESDKGSIRIVRPFGDM
jgi:hypothetical protein